MGLFNAPVQLTPLQQQQMVSIVSALRPAVQRGEAVSFGDCRFTDPQVLLAVVREANADGLAVSFTPDQSLMTVSPPKPEQAEATRPILVQLVEPLVVAVPMESAEAAPPVDDAPRRPIGF